jgi:hypothetical protein
MRSSKAFGSKGLCSWILDNILISMRDTGPLRKFKNTHDNLAENKFLYTWG